MEASRPEERIRHGPTHYVAGCNVGVPSARTANTSSESRALTLHDVMNTIEEMKRMLTHKVLPFIQNQANELTDKDRNHKHRLAEVTQDVGASVSVQTVQGTASAFFAVLEEHTSRRNDDVADAPEIIGTCQAYEARSLVQGAPSAPLAVSQKPTSRRRQLDDTRSSVQGAPSAPLTVLEEPTYRRNQAGESRSSLSLLQERIIKQNPELFFYLSPAVWKRMHKTSTQAYPQHAIEYFGPSSVRYRLKLARPLSTTRKWREVLGSVSYIVTLQKREEGTRLSDFQRGLCIISVWHTEDAYFTVKVCNSLSESGRTISVEIAFFGTLVGGRRCEPSFDVIAYNGKRGEPLSFYSRDSSCLCQRVRHSRAHFLGTFESTIDAFTWYRHLRDGKVELEIRLSNKENAQARDSRFWNWVSRAECIKLIFCFLFGMLLQQCLRNR